MIYPKLSDGTINWCVMCKNEGSDFYDLCCMCEYGEKEDDPPTCYESKPQTNADRIRAMSDEELAEYFPTHASLCPDLEENKTVCKGANFMANDKMCRKCWLDWLRQEAIE